MRRGIGGAGGIVVRADEKNLRQSMGQGLALGSILRQEETAVATTLTSGMGMGTPAGGLKEDMSGQGHFGQGQGHGYRDSHGTMVDNTDDNRMESNRPARLSHLGADGQGLDPAQGQGLGPALRMTTTPLHLTHNSSVESEVSSVVAEGVGASPLRFRKGQWILFCQHILLINFQKSHSYHTYTQRNNAPLRSSYRGRYLRQGVQGPERAHGRITRHQTTQFGRWHAV